MLLAGLLVVFLILASVFSIVGLCIFAALSFGVGRALLHSRFREWSPFLIWIPSSAAAFALSFTAYSAFALTRTWAFPANPLEFLIAFVFGEVLCVGLGAAIAFRIKKSGKMERNHAAGQRQI